MSKKAIKDNEIIFGLFLNMDLPKGCDTLIYLNPKDNKYMKEISFLLSISWLIKVGRITGKEYNIKKDIFISKVYLN